jgi:glyoxylase-like metal-dependent hydrolase (beta-lactamase superfamily II)
MKATATMLRAEMTPTAIEFHRLTNELAIWHCYDAKVKAELFSTAVATPAGVFLIDPISSAVEALSVLPEGEEPTAIVVTNENHARASHSLAERLGVPIYAAAAAGVKGAIAVEEGPVASAFEIIPIPGAPAGEVALYCAREGGTVIIGDALINFGSHGFDFLPAKYCANAKVMRRSLRKLLDHDFERLLFAHGTPIIDQARQRLTALLENAS